MTDKKWYAILAKNQIARELRDYDRNKEPISYNNVRFNLREIEKYIGEANQPSVEEILTSERNDI